MRSYIIDLGMLDRLTDWVPWSHKIKLLPLHVINAMA